MEMSHRGKEFTNIINKAEADLRQLLSIPDNYEVWSPSFRPLESFVFLHLLRARIAAYAYRS